MKAFWLGVILGFIMIGCASTYAITDPRFRERPAVDVSAIVEADLKVYLKSETIADVAWFNPEFTIGHFPKEYWYMVEFENEYWLVRKGER